MDTQLLCTFCKLNDLTKTCQQISEKYQVVSNKIFILENTGEVTNVYSEEEQQLILTYNVTNADLSDVLNSTISVHRKKQTNTIYTINALNKLIMEKNNGILDKRFRVDWEELENMVLVTAYGKLKRISTQVKQILRLDEITNT
tara:strand:- start:11 stop:442 length:432 start_codon:yes stop_codon:yes gene_type:complete